MIYHPITFTCTCPSKYFKPAEGNCLGMNIFNIYIYIYIACHSCCKECTGTENIECKLNECDKENSCYPLETAPPLPPATLNSTTCLYMCEDPTPLFLDTSSPGHEICRKCHPNCNICYGDQDNTCLQCISPKLLTDERECIYTDCTNYDNTFPTTTKCERCNEKCDGCEGSPSYCLDCTSPYLFLEETHSCLSTCPDQFYDNHHISLCQST